MQQLRDAQLRTYFLASEEEKNQSSSRVRRIWESVRSFLLGGQFPADLLQLGEQVCWEWAAGFGAESLLELISVHDAEDQGVDPLDLQGIAVGQFRWIGSGARAQGSVRRCADIVLKVGM